MRYGLSIATAALLAAVLVGCPHDEYVVTMKPKGDLLERAVVARHIEDDKNPPTTLLDTKMLVGDSMPDELGGNAGRYAVYHADLGRAMLYVERVRGDDDQATMIEAQFKAVDRLVDVVLGWTKQQFGKSAEYPKLAAFLDKDLRKDLKNVGVMAWMADVGHRATTTGPDSQACTYGAVARLAAYLVERNYLAKGDTGRLARVIQGDNAVALPLLEGVLVRKVGLADKAFIGQLLAMFGPDSKAVASLEEFVLKSPQYAEALKLWQAGQPVPQAKLVGPGQPEKDVNPAPDDQRKSDPGPSKVLIEPAFATVPGLINLGTPDDFAITLATGKAPGTSNGTFDSGSKTVKWQFTFPTGGSVPVVLYAVWAEPDEKAQIEHFGKVVLDGDKQLVEYCLWRNALTAKEAAEWGTVLAKLKPGADYGAILKDLRFSDGTEMRGAQTLLSAIGPTEK